MEEDGSLHGHHLDERYAEEHFSEELHLERVGMKNVDSWSEDPLLKVKTIIQRFFNQLGIKGKLSFEKSDFPFYHPKKQASIILRNGPQPFEI